MRTQSNTVHPGVFIQMLLFIIVFPFLPLLISWHWNWWEGWVFAGAYLMSFALSRAAVARRHPDLLKERARFLQQADAKPWDRLLSPLAGLGSGLIPLVAGLDARFSWSPGFSVDLKSLALLVQLAGYALGAYALIENRFFSGVVRIQSDRGHHVVSSGPYRWVRHPGYAGALLSYWAAPIFLDSSWALLASLLVSVVLVVRTALEDRTLMEELEGYRQYAQRVRYRLLPGLW